MPLFQPFIPKAAIDVQPETRPIFQAILNSNVDAVVAAMVAGEDLNAASAFRLTPLHVACRVYGMKAGPGFCRPADAELIIKILLSAGASPLARDALGHMPTEYCEGHSPKCLRDAMQELARQGTWPEPNPSGFDYEEGDVRPVKRARSATHVPVGGYVPWRERVRKAAA
ncbi:hypothetical protein ASG87_01395 [Frateuria sp. Soil773]|uniref:hypothetical protein n=1 Tax=Frateuria sp. Soil773 TaxID=1736407 RepID=UPI000700322E|nr:hypothetical protein [Frateuria sp. Soil773]KRE90818.1 hypothetical protein ASG87_01395 [Frateuria sp. Soil773]